MSLLIPTTRALATNPELEQCRADCREVIRTAKALHDELQQLNLDQSHAITEYERLLMEAAAVEVEYKAWYRDPSFLLMMGFFTGFALRGSK